MIKIHFNGTEYWYTVHSFNGRTLTTSETYKTKQACIKGVDALISIVHEEIKIKDETIKQ